MSFLMLNIYQFNIINQSEGCQKFLKIAAKTLIFFSISKITFDKLKLFIKLRLLPSTKGQGQMAHLDNKNSRSSRSVSDAPVQSVLAYSRNNPLKITLIEVLSQGNSFTSVSECHFLMFLKNIYIFQVKFQILVSLIYFSILQHQYSIFILYIT